MPFSLFDLDLWSAAEQGLSAKILLLQSERAHTSNKKHAAWAVKTGAAAACATCST
jgi:hypothetical protein